ncbi:ABC transporter permease [Vallitalea sediminicola]
MNEIFEIIFSANFGYSVLRVATPILFAALASLISLKVGILNIAIEGMMLTSALMAVVVSAFSGNIWLGLITGVFTGGLIGLILVYFSLKLKTNTTLTGIALNLMAGGGTVFLLYIVSGNKGISSSLQSGVLPNIDLPLINKIPIIGEILSGHNVLTYIALLMVIVIYYFIYKTPLGFKIRAVGENPDAADSVGINLMKIRYIAVIISGALAGFGGTYMSMSYVSWFSRNMSAGRGFIGIAAESMGGGTPIGTFIATLIFGFADALSNNLQFLKIPSELIQMIPYILTIIGVVLIPLIHKKRNINK